MLKIIQASTAPNKVMNFRSLLRGYGPRQGPSRAIVNISGKDSVHGSHKGLDTITALLSLLNVMAPLS